MYNEIKKEEEGTIEVSTISIVAFVLSIISLVVAVLVNISI